MPPELLRLIVEQFWEGEFPQKSDLCAFAHTSTKCWLVVRPLLFRHIIIRGPDHIRKLVEQIQETSEIALWVNELQFEGRSIPPVIELRLARCEMSPNALTAIVRAFPDLLHVFLTSVCVGSPNRASLAEVKAHPPIISGMSLNNCNIHAAPNPLKEKIAILRVKITLWSIPYIMLPHGSDLSLSTTSRLNTTNLILNTFGVGFGPGLLLIACNTSGLGIA